MEENTKKVSGTEVSSPKIISTPFIETNRLTLERFSLNDAPAMFASWMNSENVTKYMFIDSRNSITCCKDYIRSTMRKYEKKSGYNNWIIKLNNVAIGGISLYIDNSNDSGTIGYVLSENMWGNGYVPEALNAVIDYAFNTLHLNRLDADHFAENIASGNVLKKAGFVQEGYMKQRYKKSNVYHDSVYYALLRQRS